MSSFDRICWFYNRLKQIGHPTRQNYMDVFEVSESTFKRDIALMRDRMGAPVAYAPESGDYVLTDGAYEIPSFWFNRRRLLMMIGICKQLQKTEAAMADGDLTLFKMKILKYGSHVEVLEPGILRDQVAGEAEKIVKIYGG